MVTVTILEVISGMALFSWVWTIQITIMVLLFLPTTRMEMGGA
jgi:hypothetical protein